MAFDKLILVCTNKQNRYSWAFIKQEIGKLEKLTNIAAGVIVLSMFAVTFMQIN